MIASLMGILKRKETNWIIIDVGGVGYKTTIPLSTYYNLPNLGEKLELQIITIVREDAISLFGFWTMEEKKLFELLISVSKVGPKLAISFLSGMEVIELVQAIQREDVFTLKAIPGVGLKTAERIILELKNKVSKLSFAKAGTSSIVTDSNQKIYENVLAGLITLGYNKSQADKAIRQALKSKPEELTMESLLKESLQIITKRNK